MTWFDQVDPPRDRGHDQNVALRRCINAGGGILGLDIQVPAIEPLTSVILFDTDDGTGRVIGRAKTTPMNITITITDPVALRILGAGEIAVARAEDIKTALNDEMERILDMDVKNTHWIRILPDSRCEIWQTTELKAPPHASDVLCCDKCPDRTWWAPLIAGRLLAAVEGLQADAEGPCKCVTVTEHNGVLGTAEVVSMGDWQGGRPFMARFSWTVGLPWEPPVEAREEDGVVVLYRHDGTRLARTKPGTTRKQALLELRLALY
jgi:hypothetical protein